MLKTPVLIELFIFLKYLFNWQVPHYRVFKKCIAAIIAMFFDVCGISGISVYENIFSDRKKNDKDME